MSPPEFPPLRVRVATCNVLYEAYYRRHCKRDAVPAERRCEMFVAALQDMMAAHDVLALQEWPYDGDTQHASVLTAEVVAATGGGERVAAATSSGRRRWNRGESNRGEVQRDDTEPTRRLRHAPPVDVPIGAAWRRALDAVVGRAGWGLVTHAAADDGLLLAVNLAVYDVLRADVRGYSPRATRPGTKKRMAVLLRHRAAGETLGVLNAHVPWARDAAQACVNVREVFALADVDATPHWVAVGDFNVQAPVGERAEEFYEAALPRGWTDATAAADAMTAAGDHRDQKIDYIVLSPSLALRNVRVHPRDPSANVQHVRERGMPTTWFSDHSVVAADVEVARS